MVCALRKKKNKRNTLVCLRKGKKKRGEPKVNKEFRKLSSLVETHTLTKKKKREAQQKMALKKKLKKQKTIKGAEVAFLFFFQKRKKEKVRR